MADCYLPINYFHSCIKPTSLLANVAKKSQTFREEILPIQMANDFLKSIVNGDHKIVFYMVSKMCKEMSISSTPTAKKCRYTGTFVRGLKMWMQKGNFKFFPTCITSEMQCWRILEVDKRSTNEKTTIAQIPKKKNSKRVKEHKSMLFCNRDRKRKKKK